LSQNRGQLKFLDSHVVAAAAVAYQFLSLDRLLGTSALELQAYQLLLIVDVALEICALTVNLALLSVENF
jgi:hypothetical protein